MNMIQYACQQIHKLILINSTVNSDNNTIATGSGTLAVTILTMTVLMSGIVAAYFLKKKRA